MAELIDASRTAARDGEISYSEAVEDIARDHTLEAVPADLWDNYLGEVGRGDTLPGQPNWEFLAFQNDESVSQDDRDKAIFIIGIDRKHNSIWSLVSVPYS